MEKQPAVHVEDPQKRGLHLTVHDLLHDWLHATYHLLLTHLPMPPKMEEQPAVRVEDPQEPRPQEQNWLA